MKFLIDDSVTNASGSNGIDDEKILMVCFFCFAFNSQLNNRNAAVSPFVSIDRERERERGKKLTPALHKNKKRSCKVREEEKQTK